MGIKQEWETVTGFGLRVLQNLQDKGKNILVSPVSIFNALAITANGAKGETLAQFESVLGASVKKCNSYIKTFNNILPSGDRYRLANANSIWIDERKSFKTEPGFIKKIQDLYGASIFISKFSKKTASEINNWVNQNTDGMVTEIIKEVPDNVRMYLINALAFDAGWQDTYYKESVKGGIFKKEDGTKQEVSFMYSKEGIYLEDKNTTGFIKYYADFKYAFIALLPDKGTSMEEYIKEFNTESFKNLIKNKRMARVNTAVPKFKSGYMACLKKTLKQMGLTKAFDYVMADFTGIGNTLNNNLYIDNVLHKTFIEVCEKGTRAGVAAGVVMAVRSASVHKEVKTVYLDRPFIYIIADCSTWLPLFAGVMHEINLV